MRERIFRRPIFCFWRPLAGSGLFGRRWTDRYREGVKSAIGALGMPLTNLGVLRVVPPSTRQEWKGTGGGKAGGMGKAPGIRVTWPGKSMGA